MLKRSTKELLIIAFCLWHMFAIAAYMLPNSTPSTVWNGLVEWPHAIARPYVFAVSQWQKWDIFSPDPLRRISVYRIEQKTDGGWEPVFRMDAVNLPWYEQAKELKILGRLEENWGELVASYLHSRCASIPGSEGEYVRLVASSVVLPKELRELKHISGWQPAPAENILGQARCPSSTES